MHWRRAHLLGSCAAACSAMYVWPAADACSSGLQVGWLGASLVMAPCASFSFRHGHRAYATRRVQPRCPVVVGHTTRGPARHSPRLGALIRIGIAPAFAYWASTTRGWCVWLSAPGYSPPGRAQLSLFPLCRWSAFVSGNPAGSVAARLGGCWLQSHQQVETARYPEPGMGGFSRDSSRFCLRRSGLWRRLSGLRRDRNCERARLGGLAQGFVVGRDQIITHRVYSVKHIS